MAAPIECPCCGLSVIANEPLIGGVAVCPHCTTRFVVNRAAVEAARGQAHAFLPPTPVGARFTFKCQRCDSILEARGDQGGQHGRCPTCGGVFVIPALDALTGLAKGPAVVAADGQLPTPMHAYATAGGKAPKIRRLDDGRQVIVCPRCGRDMPVDADTCTGCGLPFTMDGADRTAHAGYASNGWATSALVTGVFAIPTFCFPIAGVAAIGLGLAGLQRAGQLGERAPGRGSAITGMALGVLSCAAWAVHTFW